LKSVLAAITQHLAGVLPTHVGYSIPHGAVEKVSNNRYNTSPASHLLLAQKGYGWAAAAGDGKTFSAKKSTHKKEKKGKKEGRVKKNRGGGLLLWKPWVPHNQVKTVIDKGYLRHFCPECILSYMWTNHVGYSNSHGTVDKVSEKEEIRRIGA
jgi:hypothetical protein